MTTAIDVEVVIPVTVTGRIMSDLLISAFEGGSNYWVRSLRLFDRDGHRVAGLVDHPVQDLSSIVVVEDDNGKEHTLTMPGVVKPGQALGKHVSDLEVGLRIMAEKHTNHFTNLINDDADAETGDVFLQCCLFGEIVYG